MRIYFGRNPKTIDNNVLYIDIAMLDRIKLTNYQFEQAVELLIKEYLRREEHDQQFDADDYKILYTLNPLFLNYLTDEQALAFLWFIDEEGNHIECCKDDKFIYNLNHMQPGEAIADDDRILK